MPENVTDQNGRSRFTSGVAHFIFILIIFVLPELVMTIALPHKRSIGIFPGIYIKTVIYIIAFYLNYSLIVTNTLGRPGRRIGRFVLYNVLILIGGIVLCYISSRICYPPRAHHHAISLWQQVLKSTSFILRDGVMIVLSIGLAVALRLSAMWQDIEKKRQQSLAEQRATELDGLKSQLNPHFLFNTLNTIYALIDICPDDAKAAVHRLSGLLRYMLYEDVRSVRLAQEADFIEDYVSLMRLRMSGRAVDISIDIDGHGETTVPPLLFIPLVENAFKHGNSAPDNRPIAISLKVSDGKIVCTTSNSFVATPAGTRSKDSGIGLTNLRRRLSLIYEGKASLRTKVEGNIYTGVLTIPLEMPQNQDTESR